MKPLQHETGNRFIRFLAREKTVLTYASSVCTLPLIALNAALAVHDKLAAADIHIPTYLLLVILCVAIWMIGTVLFRCGLPQAESKFALEINPEWQEMKKEIKALNSWNTNNGGPSERRPFAPVEKDSG